MKKILALILALVLVFALVACGSGKSSETKTDSGETAETVKTDKKIGVILVGDENETYSLAHMNGIKEAVKATGFPEENVIWKYNVPENEVTFDTAVELAEAGCCLIIANSYSHQSYMQQAATEYPEVTFISMTGDNAKISGLPNMKNAFTRCYQARYVTGVVAGMKLKELIDQNKLTEKNYFADGTIRIGYVGAFPYAEVVSGMSGFYLGLKSVVSNVTMEVSYTNSWFDITAEAEAANALISDGCCIIAQHSDSTGVPSTCQKALESGTIVYNVGYNMDIRSVAPDAALTSALNNWGVYYTYVLQCVLEGKEVMTDWTEGYETDAVAISELGKSCAAGTAEKVAETIQAIKEGKLEVFSTDNFTVDGQKVTSWKIDITGDFVPDDDAESIVNGVFVEGLFRSAPAFSIPIDGIIELN